MPAPLLDPDRNGVDAPPPVQRPLGPLNGQHAGTQAADRPCILVAERDQQVRQLQRFFLERAGYAVEFADDGSAALERARISRPVLVVTEILLPKLDGLSLCRRLREDSTTADIPVVVFSMLAAGARAGEAGARAFLRKPLIESVFLAAVRDALATQPSPSMEQQ